MQLGIFAKTFSRATLALLPADQKGTCWLGSASDRQATYRNQGGKVSLGYNISAAVDAVSLLQTQLVAPVFPPPKSTTLTRTIFPSPTMGLPSPSSAADPLRHLPDLPPGGAMSQPQSQTHRALQSLYQRLSNRNTLRTATTSPTEGHHPVGAFSGLLRN